MANRTRASQSIRSRVSGVLMLCALSLLSCAAKAQDWFQFEAGAGLAISRDSDGQWVQYGEPHTETRSAPSVMLGATGPIWSSGRFGIDWHADFLYNSQIEASCSCVPDADYNPVTHQVISHEALPAYFSGSGREIGFMLTVAPYVWVDGFKVSAEGGAYIFRQFWNETVVYPDDPAIYPASYNNKIVDDSHHPVWQLTWTAGVSVSRGPWTLAYHFLPDVAPWNPFPGLIQKTHLITMTYRF